MGWACWLSKGGGKAAQGRASGAPRPFFLGGATTATRYVLKNVHTRTRARTDAILHVYEHWHCMDCEAADGNRLSVGQHVRDGFVRCILFNQRGCDINGGDNLGPFRMR